MADNFKNTSGETIPAWAIIQVVGAVTVGRSRMLDAKKPVQSNRVPAVFAFNGPTAIPANKTGRARMATAGAVWGKYATGDGSPSFGQMWGPDGSSWELRKDKPGFIVVGEPQGGAVLVVEELVIIRYAELTQNLAKATSMKTGEKTAQAKLIINNPSAHGDLIDGPTVTVTNRWTHYEADSGDKLKVEWDRHYREWAPYVSEC